MTFVWTIGDVIAVVIVGCAVVVALTISTVTALRQRFCLHEKFSEARDCSAICNLCGKNLGFIGTVRKQQGANHD